jgi:hypothetical protein
MFVLVKQPLIREVVYGKVELSTTLNAPPVTCNRHAAHSSPVRSVEVDSIVPSLVWSHDLP